MKELMTDAFESKEDIVEVEQDIDLLAISDILNITHEIDQIESAIDIAENTKMSLEALITDLESAKESKSLSTEALVFAQHAATAALKPLGLSLEVPTLESIHSDELSLESIKDVLSKIWEGIKKFVAKWLTKIRDFIMGTERAATALLEESKKLKPELTELTSKLPTNIVVSLSLTEQERNNLIAGDKLNLDGDLSNIYHIVDGLPKAGFVKVIDGISAEVSKIKDEDLVKAETRDVIRALITTAYNSTSSALSNIDVRPTKKGNPSELKSIKRYSTGTLMGRLFIVVDVPIDLFTANYDNIKVSTGNDKKFSGSQSWHVPKKDVLLKSNDLISNICQSIIDNRKVESDIEKALSKLDKVISAKVKATDKEGNSAAAKQNINSLTNLYKTMNIYSYSLNYRVNRVSLVAAKNSFLFLKRCISEMKKSNEKGLDIGKVSRLSK